MQKSGLQKSAFLMDIPVQSRNDILAFTRRRCPLGGGHDKRESFAQFAGSYFREQQAPRINEARLRENPHTEESGSVFSGFGHWKLRYDRDHKKKNGAFQLRP